LVTEDCMTTRREWLGGAAAAALIGISKTAAAQDLPRGPVRLVVPFGPGGTTDILARFLRPGMESFLGQPVVVENRTGAAGNIAMENVVRSNPDGTSVFVGDVGTSPSLLRVAAASTGSSWRCWPSVPG
jgi:tripartite-type tricarboxylate transporter receptor subunit TctC